VEWIKRRGLVEGTEVPASSEDFRLHYLSCGATSRPGKLPQNPASASLLLFFMAGSKGYDYRMHYAILPECIFLARVISFGIPVPATVLGW
jgi:hypothetical protein